MSTVALTPASTTVSEGVATVTFTITRSQSTGSETVNFSTIQNQGSTNSGDYTGFGGLELVNAGTINGNVAIYASNDLFIGRLRRFRQP